jgi:hypothetical protein
MAMARRIKGKRRGMKGGMYHNGWSVKVVGDRQVPLISNVVVRMTLVLTLTTDFQYHGVRRLLPLTQ